MDNNYLKLHSRMPFTFQYIFVDTADHLFERMMKRNGVRLKCVREYMNDRSGIRLISCRIWKKEESHFHEALEQIRNAALLMGYSEYEDICGMLMNCAEKEQKKQQGKRSTMVSCQASE